VSLRIEYPPEVFGCRSAGWHCTRKRIGLFQLAVWSVCSGRFRVLHLWRIHLLV